MNENRFLPNLFFCNIKGTIELRVDLPINNYVQKKQKNLFCRAKYAAYGN